MGYDFDLDTPEGQREYMRWASDDAKSSMMVFGVAVATLALYGLVFAIVVLVS